MSYAAKRFISTACVGKGLYTSKTGNVVKMYLEEHGLYEWAKSTTGVDDNGAAEAEVSGAGHSGGTVQNEPFHCNVVVKDASGDTIQVVNPHTDQKTDVWHAYLANSKEDLKNKALTWHNDKYGCK